MIRHLKRLAASLPTSMQQELRRLHFARQRRTGTFASNEKEFRRLGEWVRPGDWTIDVGANVGHYTLALAKRVGSTGRVFAFEPIARTFELLAAAAADESNVTLLNAAASNDTREVAFDIPDFEWGLQNLYAASIRDSGSAAAAVCLPIDSLALPKRVSFIKVDAEGHELEVLQGASSLIQRDLPTLLVEDNSEQTTSWLRDRGYVDSQAPGSSNRLFIPRARTV